MERMRYSPECSRHKCAACFKQFNKMEHLVEHMKLTYHSEHEPICGICKKHCRYFDALREHLLGPLPKVECSEQLRKRGCNLCLNFFESAAIAAEHRAICLSLFSVRAGSHSLVHKRIQAATCGNHIVRRCPVSAVALDCEMVGGGHDGKQDLCARVCLVDEEENLLFATNVKPQIPVTDYRFHITGIGPQHLVDAMPVTEVAEKIKQILYNGESFLQVHMTGGKAKLLVGHGLKHDLNCLMFEYPSHRIRDTSKYPPLLKTCKSSHPLKYLTETLLGYEIQNGHHNPYEDAVAAMRIYKKMRSLIHMQRGGKVESPKSNIFESLKQKDLERMTPDALLAISQSDFDCWCLDARSAPCSFCCSSGTLHYVGCSD